MKNYSSVILKKVPLTMRLMPCSVISHWSSLQRYHLPRMWKWARTLGKRSAKRKPVLALDVNLGHSVTTGQNMVVGIVDAQRASVATLYLGVVDDNLVLAVV